MKKILLATLIAVGLISTQIAEANSFTDWTVVPRQPTTSETCNILNNGNSTGSPGWGMQDNRKSGEFGGVGSCVRQNACTTVSCWENGMFHLMFNAGEGGCRNIHIQGFRILNLQVAVYETFDGEQKSWGEGVVGGAPNFWQLQACVPDATDWWVGVFSPCYDNNFDGAITASDINNATANFGKIKGQQGFSALYDIDNNGAITATDINAVVSQFGYTCDNFDPNLPGTGA